MKTILTLFLLIALTGCKSTSSLKVVEGFDSDKYMGVWYEAARLPHGFEKGMSSVSATYSKNEDGTVKVLNRGYKDADKEWEQIEGVAKFKGASDIGWLKVSFFKPFYASYKILYLNEDYTEAIVTGPSFGYLWILVRNPALPDDDLNRLVAQAKSFGFDTTELIMVDQARNQP